LLYSLAFVHSEKLPDADQRLLNESHPGSASENADSQTQFR
jgi:hypothetical protein